MSKSKKNARQAKVLARIMAKHNQIDVAGALLALNLK